MSRFPRQGTVGEMLTVRRPGNRREGKAGEESCPKVGEVVEVAVVHPDQAEGR